MINVQNIVKTYGATVAVNKISFKVNPGEILGFLGPNGAGKSTTLKILTGFIVADSGTVSVDGHDVLEESLQVRRLVGYLPESTPLYSDMRVLDFLRFVARARQVPASLQAARMDTVIAATGIERMLKKNIGHLSKGYRQRVGLAQAIVSDPHVLILDEPTIGLDPRQIADIRALIKSLAGEHTVILSTHILPEVSMVCSAVVIINRGAIVAQGPIDMLVEQFFPSSRVEVEIAGPVPAVRDAMRAIPGVLNVTEVAGDGAGRYVVESARARDVRGEIFQLAAQQRWHLRELRRVGMTLEEVFMRVVAGEEAPPGAPVEPVDKVETEPRVETRVEKP